MQLDGLKHLVVGSGLFGAVVAERIAEDLGERVLVVDRRPHAGGNCFSEPDPATGIEVHRYGTHIFHTSSEPVWRYVQRFCGFNSYRHRVLAMRRGRVYQMPINLATINQFYDRDLTPSEAGSLLRAEAAKERGLDLSTLEGKAVSLVGRPLYDAFIRGYTAKQWRRDPRQLPAEIITRLAFRLTYKSDYFDDPWQGLPLIGYGALLRKILAHERIELLTGTDYFDIADKVPPSCLTVFTGPIDRYFGLRAGALGWRTVRFEPEVLDTPDFQGTSVMNYVDEDVPWMRLHEFRHLHEERRYSSPKTVVFREYSLAAASRDDEPYYPVRSPEDMRVFQAYQAMAEGVPNVLFGGRLGSYRYLDMDKTIAAALELYAAEIRTRRTARKAARTHARGKVSGGRRSRA